MLRDKPRAEAREALAAMEEPWEVDRLVLLTGDRAAGRLVKWADALRMDEVVAEVLPAQKLDMVRAEQADGTHRHDGRRWRE